MRWLDGITDITDMSVSKLLEILKDRKPGALQSMGLQTVGYNLATGQQPPVKDKIFDCSLLYLKWLTLSEAGHIFGTQCSLMHEWLILCLT